MRGVVVVVLALALAVNAISVDKGRRMLFARKAQSTANAPGDWTISANLYGNSQNPVFQAHAAIPTNTLRKYKHGFMAWLNAKKNAAPGEPVAAKLVLTGPEAVAEWTAHKALAAACPDSVPKAFDNFAGPPSTTGAAQEYQVQEALTGGDISTTFAGDLVAIKTIAKQLVTALQCIHTKGKYLHRDIKVGNILLDAKGAAKFIDFGESRPVDFPYNDPTQVWGLQQTPGYSPHWRALGCDRAPTCTAADRTAAELYALGLSLLCAYTGKSLSESLNGPAHAPGTGPPYQALEVAFFTGVAPITDIQQTATSIGLAMAHTPLKPASLPLVPAFANFIHALCTSQTVTTAAALAHPFLT